MSTQTPDRRYAVAAVAIRLFIERGYDAVTAEDIARAAGIGSRTFFRHFPTKEHAAFPDHEERVERFRAGLLARTGSVDPVAAAVEVAVASAKEYFDQPELYRPRYKLVHEEPALRDHERIADRAYELAITEFLTKELRERPAAGLAAPIVAAGLVAAVNQVLDTWAFDETVDAARLLETGAEVARRIGRAAFGGGAVPADVDSNPSGVVLVLSADAELRHQITEVVRRHQPTSDGPNPEELTP